KYALVLLSHFAPASPANRVMDDDRFPESLIYGRGVSLERCDRPASGAQITVRSRNVASHKRVPACLRSLPDDLLGRPPIERHTCRDRYRPTHHNQPGEQAAKHAQNTCSYRLVRGKVSEVESPRQTN